MAVFHPSPLSDVSLAGDSEGTGRDGEGRQRDGQRDGRRDGRGNGKRDEGKGKKGKEKGKGGDGRASLSPDSDPLMAPESMHPAAESSTDLTPYLLGGGLLLAAGLGYLYFSKRQ